MKSFIISECMLKKKARELMLKFYEYILYDYNSELKNPAEDIEKQKKYWHDNLVNEYMSFLNIYEIKQKIKDGKESFSIAYNLSDLLYIKPKDIVDLRVLKGDDLKRYIENKIMNKNIEPDFVYYFLDKIDREVFVENEFELDEDCYCLRKAFLKAWDLFYFSGYNLED